MLIYSVLCVSRLSHFPKNSKLEMLHFAYILLIVIVIRISILCCIFSFFGRVRPRDVFPNFGIFRVEKTSAKKIFSVSKIDAVSYVRMIIGLLSNR